MPSLFGYYFRLDSPKSYVEGTMPNIKSAKKRMELSRAANTRNRVNRSRIKTAIRRVREAETAEAAQVHMKEAISLLDRAATKRLLPPNRVARIKSQIAQRVNGMSAAS
jgi:small subunit ribosomal protein S20